jgi:hypothetical protein
MQGAEKRLDETFLLRLLLRKDVIAIPLAACGVRVKRLVICEDDEFHSTIATVIDQVDQVNIDFAKSLRSRSANVCHCKITATHLPALGDGLWDRFYLDVTTQLLPFLKLRHVGTVQCVNLACNSLDAALLTLRLGQTLSHGQAVKHRVEVVIGTSSDAVLREVALLCDGAT